MKSFLSRMQSQLTSSTACSDTEDQDQLLDTHLAKPNLSLICSPEYQRSHSLFHSLKVRCLRTRTSEQLEADPEQFRRFMLPGFAVLHLSDLCYMAGGSFRNITSPLFSSLSLNSASITSLPALRIPRQCMSICEGQSRYILISGGYSSTQRKIKSCDYYDSISQKWKDSLPNTKEPRYDHASLILSGFVYLFGGMFKSQRQSYESYDLGTSTHWKRNRVLSQIGRAPFTLLPFNNQLILLNMRRSNYKIFDHEGQELENAGITGTELDWNGVAFSQVKNRLWVVNSYGEACYFCTYSRSFIE